MFKFAGSNGHIMRVASPDACLLKCLTFDAGEDLRYLGYDLGVYPYPYRKVDDWPCGTGTGVKGGASNLLKQPRL